MDLPFEGMTLYGTDKLSVLTMPDISQANEALKLYNEIEGEGFIERNNNFLRRYAEENIGAINFAGSILSLQKNQNNTSREDIFNATREISLYGALIPQDLNQKFSYFACNNPQGDKADYVIFRGKDFIKAWKSHKEDSLELLAMTDNLRDNNFLYVSQISMSHGLNNCLMVGPVC